MNVNGLELYDYVRCTLKNGDPFYFEGDKQITNIDPRPEFNHRYRVDNRFWYTDEQIKYASSPTIAEPDSIVAGVGKDAPTVVNESGGKQSGVLYDFTLADPKAMFEMTRVLHEGAEKYGRENWRLIPIEEHLNHMIIHAYAYLAGDKSDAHLSHIMCRALFAQGVAVQTEGDVDYALAETRK
jgi:hypothetical protein